MPGNQPSPHGREETTGCRFHRFVQWKMAVESPFEDDDRLCIFASVKLEINICYIFIGNGCEWREKVFFFWTTTGNRQARIGGSRSFWF